MLFVDWIWPISSKVLARKKFVLKWIFQVGRQVLIVKLHNCPGEAPKKGLKNLLLKNSLKGLCGGETRVRTHPRKGCQILLIQHTKIGKIYQIITKWL
jgi:hypothetical protein